MGENKKNIFQKIPVKPLFLALFLVCSIASTGLFFAYGFDVERKFLSIPVYLCAIPLVIPFPLFLTMEVIGGEKNSILPFLPSKYKTILKASLNVAVLGLALGLVLLLLSVNKVFQDATEGLPIQLISIMFMPGQLFYLALCLGYFFKDHNKKASLIFGLALVLTLTGFLVGVIASGTLSFGWGLFYLASPMSLLIITMIEDKPLATEPGQEVKQS